MTGCLWLPEIHIGSVENQVHMGEEPGIAIVRDGEPVSCRTGRVNIDVDNFESIKVIRGAAAGYVKWKLMRHLGDTSNR